MFHSIENVRCRKASMSAAKKQMAIELYSWKHRQWNDCRTELLILYSAPLWLWRHADVELFQGCSKEAFKDSSPRESPSASKDLIGGIYSSGVFLTLHRLLLESLTRSRLLALNVAPLSSGLYILASLRKTTYIQHHHNFISILMVTHRAACFMLALLRCFFSTPNYSPWSLASECGGVREG